MANATTTTLSRHYAGLAPHERLVAVLEATARRDYAEAGRLGGSCPRRDYTANDRAFADRVGLASDAAAVAAIELRGLCGQLKALRWAAAVLDGLAPLRRLDAELTFMAGVRAGLVAAWGLDDEDGGNGPGPEREPAHARAVDDTAVAGGEGWAVPLAAALERAGQSHAGHRLLLDRAAADVAGELAAAWAGLGRFCRGGPGVPPATLLGARRLGTLAAQVTDLLRQQPGVRPDPARVAEYARLIGGLWDERFGGPDDGDADEEHQP